VNVPLLTAAQPEAVSRGASPEEVVWLIHAVRRAMHHAYARYSPAQQNPEFIAYIPILAAVAQQPGVTVSELGRATGVPKSRVSLLIGRAVERALVAREPDPDDQRLVRLHLTPEGRSQLARWRAEQHRILLRALRTLHPEQLATVTASLGLLLDALQPEPGAPEPPQAEPEEAHPVAVDQPC
jgi:DNA-binding MarR family transcriptional regulator